MELNKIRCPECNKELLTDGGYLQRAPQPDPQPDGDIVKAVQKRVLETTADSPEGGRYYHLELEEMALRIARATEAKIQKNEQGIEDLENRGCVTENSGWVEDITEWRKESERKLEELEEKVQGHHTEIGQAHDRLHNHWKYIHPLAKKAGLFDEKPQPKGGVARCKDEKGIYHDLTPGRSVVQYLEDDNINEPVEGIFFQLEGTKLWAYWCEHNCLASYPRFADKDTVVWLRNLDFPGGDK